MLIKITYPLVWKLVLPGILMGGFVRLFRAAEHNVWHIDVKGGYQTGEIHINLEEKKAYGASDAGIYCYPCLSTVREDNI